MIQLTFDTAALDNKVSRMLTYARREAITVIGSAVREDIIANSARGVDAHKKPFTRWTPPPGSKRKGAGPYSPEQERRRRKGGYQTAYKDLRVKGQLLDSLGMRRGMLTVTPSQQRKAHGQMFHPRWRYHHEFLLASADAIRIGERRIATGIEGA